MQEDVRYSKTIDFDLPKHNLKGEILETNKFDQNLSVPIMPLPQIVEFTAPVKQIACGAYHSMLLTEQGQVFGSGLNSVGQLGIGEG